MAQFFKERDPIDFTKTIDRSIFKDRTALVTGGASGIGLAIATTLAEAGAHVTLADISDSNGKDAIESLKSKGHSTAQFVKTDVTSWDDQVAAFAQAADASPSKTIDIVVPAAGITSHLSKLPHPSEQDTPMKPPTTTWDVNLYGTLYSLNLALWYFNRSPPNPAKQVLFVASMAGYFQPPGEQLSGDYSSSKFGVRGLWQSVWPLGPKYGDARFNLLAPTFIDTPMMEEGEMEYLKTNGFKIGTIADAVDGAMRCLCDGGVNGRAVVILGGEANGGQPGSANFDACDELPCLFGGKAIVENALQGKFMDLTPP